MSALHRFLDSVPGRSAADCWEWTGPVSPSGYGVFSFRREGRHTSTSAHRAVYAALIGPVPDGLQLDHLCENKVCCNPSHLNPTTQLANILRSNGAGALNARKTHCYLGHPLEGDNLLVSAGRRFCRTCKRATDQRTKERRRRLVA